MKSAPIPRNEHQRLDALRRTELLDTPREAAFDAITSLSATLFGMPIVLISLVDERRQWFKSAFGLDGVVSTGRDVSFCAHTILDDGVFEVRDAHADPRFADNPLVTGEPKIGYYAGMPLVDPGGNALGSLCLIDRKPRFLSPVARQQLRELARSVVGLIAMRMRPTEVADFRRAIVENKAAEDLLRDRMRRLNDSIQAIRSAG